MELFYLVNGWAGRNAWLDATLRFFYAGITPLLATILIALVVFWRHYKGERHPFSRKRLGLAGVVTLVLGVLTILGINAFQMSVLGGAPLSARPFMMHWVNLLVVEPNGNTFPCFEVMFAAATATLLWAVRPSIGLGGWAAVILLGFARIYCGSNYLADSIAGSLLGTALAAFALSACHVRLRVPVIDHDGDFWRWRVRHQGMVAGGSLVALFAVGFIWVYQSPAHSAKMHGLWGPNASAAPTEIVTSTANSAPPLHDNIHEGESDGPANEVEAGAPGKSLLDTRAARLDGHLPEVEKMLSRALLAAKLPHRLVGVNVAQVVAGTTGYRCAAIRFEVTATGPEERRRVATTAAAMVKCAFKADPELKHIDILGVRLDRNTSSVLEAPRSKTVFTAAIERSELVITQPGKPKWVNAPNLEGGLWLRARSLLYIDPQFLPDESHVSSTFPTPEDIAASASPTATPTPTPKPTPRPKPRHISKPKPRATPIPTPQPTPLAALKPIPLPTATLAPQATPAQKPVAPKPAATPVNPVTPGAAPATPVVPAATPVKPGAVPPAQKPAVTKPNTSKPVVTKPAVTKPTKSKTTVKKRTRRRSRRYGRRYYHYRNGRRYWRSR